MKYAVPLFLSCLFFSRDASAQTELIDEARQLVESQEYRRAHELVSSAQTRGTLDGEALRESYQLLAQCAAALRNPGESRDAYIALLALDPDFYVSSAESPLFRGPFEEALAYWEEHERPRFQFEPPSSIARDSPYTFAIDLDLTVLPELYSTASLHLRGVDGLFSSIPIEDGRVNVSKESFAGLEALELFITVHDAFGNLSANIGSEEAPLRVDFEAEGRGVGRRRGEERRFYQRWWFWTAIFGTLAVGLTVGLVVGLVTGREDPCQEAFGTECELEVALGSQ